MSSIVQYVFMAHEEVPKFYFDLAEGQLIVGDAAYSQQLEAGASPEDLQPLAQVLAERIMPHSVECDRMDVLRLTHADAVSYVWWINQEVLDPEVRLTERLLTHANKLGLGPSHKRLASAAGGSLSELYDEAGLTNVQKRGYYDTWTREDIVQYVGEVADTVPKTQSLKRKIEELSRAGEGPSRKVIARRIGPLSEVLTMSGRVEATGWTEEDYLDWGVKFMLANNGMAITSRALNQLSPKRRAPARSTVLDVFNSLDGYRLLVEPRYLEEKERVETQQKASFQRAMKELAAGELPPRLFGGASSEVEIRALAARFKVVRDLFPNIPEAQACELAERKSKSFPAAVIRYGKDNIHAGDIEESALLLDVYDDIWPLDDYMQLLKLPA